MSLSWNKMFISGYKEVDDEHKSILKLAKKVKKTTKTKNFDQILASFDVFVSAIRDHFKSEEQIMAEHGIDQLEGHRKLHQNYLQVLADVREWFCKEQSVKTFKKEFKNLCIGMTKHIINYDVPVFQELQQQMVT